MDELEGKECAVHVSVLTAVISGSLRVAGHVQFSFTWIRGLWCFAQLRICKYISVDCACKCLVMQYTQELHRLPCEISLG